MSKTVDEQLDELLDDNNCVRHCCGQRGTSLEEAKQQIKALITETNPNGQIQLLADFLLTNYPEEITGDRGGAVDVAIAILTEQLKEKL